MSTGQPGKPGEHGEGFGGGAGGQGGAGGAGGQSTGEGTGGAGGAGGTGGAGLRIWMDKRVIAVVLIGLALLVGYQVYAYQQQHRVAKATQIATKAAAKVKKISKAQCGQTVAFYTLINQLLDDTSPHFASPADGPIIPGARNEAITRIHNLEQSSYAALRKQGCHIPTS